MSNSRSFRRATAVFAATAAGALILVPAAAAAPAPETATGPSTATAPYIVPVAPGVSVTSLLTVDDGSGVAGYPMVGIPDGLGAYANDSGSFTALIAHELRATQGVERAHSQKGAFVSKWTIDTKSGTVTSGEDLIKDVYDWTYDYAGEGVYDTDTDADSAFARFCSASLTEPGQLLGTKGKGYDGQVFFGNEENGDIGRTFGITLDGDAVQLPRLGLGSIENTIVAPTKGDRTVVISNEDGEDNASLLRVYVGTKTSTGTPIDKAGLSNGRLHVLRVTDGSAMTDTEFRGAYPKGTPATVSLAEVNWNRSAADQRIDAAAVGALGLTRIEDGAFDPRKPNDFYFLTTEGNPMAPPVGWDGDSLDDDKEIYRDGGGLWRLSFADVNDPSKGATLTLLLDGSEAPYLMKPDNMTIDNGGNILIQEDSGNDSHVGRIVAYRIADGKLGTVAEFDPEAFSTTGNEFLTKDEESSGIIDISALVKKPNTFLLDAQAHRTTVSDSTALVEKGQLLTMTVKSWGQVYGG